MTTFLDDLDELTPEQLSYIDGMRMCISIADDFIAEGLFDEGLSAKETRAATQTAFMIREELTNQLKVALNIFLSDGEGDDYDDDEYYDDEFEDDYDEEDSSNGGRA